MADRPTLYSIPGSNAALAAKLALQHKRIDYRKVDLPPGIHWGILRVLGFPGRTVPAMRIDGRRVQGTRAVSAELERVHPDPPLFPPDRREQVKEMERWSEEELQPILRHIQPYALRRDRSAVRGFLEMGRTGLPPGLAARTAGPMLIVMEKVNRSNEDAARAALVRLPGVLDQIDAWIAEGALDSSAPTAADLHIASTVHTLLRFDDLREDIEARPAGRHARALVPPDVARIGHVLPKVG